MVKKRHYPPAYYRYKAKHKTVVFTVNLDDYKKIEKLAKFANKSISEYVRRVVLKFDDEQKNFIDIYYNIGYDDGFHHKENQILKNS